MILEEIGKFKDYELLDSGLGQRLERFGEFVLVRPDPDAIWERSLVEKEWSSCDALFLKQGEERGEWKLNTSVPDKWLMRYEEMSFYAKLAPFKHTGVFPEQAANWDFITSKFKEVPQKRLRVLNLFGYTGIASVLCAKLGAEVTHVDASKPSISWAKENMLSTGLKEDAIRWILDDCLKFVKREVRRESQYDAIIMDPPAFGRGAKGEVWKFNENLPELLENTAKLCSKDFSFLIVNAYAVSASSLLLGNLLEDFVAKAGLPETAQVSYGELVLQESNERLRLLSTGSFGRISV